MLIASSFFLIFSPSFLTRLYVCMHTQSFRATFVTQNDNIMLIKQTTGLGVIIN